MPKGRPSFEGVRQITKTQCWKYKAIIWTAEGCNLHVRIKNKTQQSGDYVGITQRVSHVMGTNFATPVTCHSLFRDFFNYCIHVRGFLRTEPPPPKACALSRLRASVWASSCIPNIYTRASYLEVLESELGVDSETVKPSCWKPTWT